MLDFINKAFNQVAFPIQMPVVFAPIRPAVATFGNDGATAARSDCLNKRLGIVTFVGNQKIKREVGNQIARLPMVALLATR